MNGSFRGLYSQIRRQWIRKLHDKATVDKLNANAVSNEVRGPMDPTRVKKWNPWRSPFMWTIGFIPFFTFGLGTWQIKRLQWKNGLIKDAEEELAKKPFNLSDYSELKTLPPYRKVVLHGTWLHSKSLLLGPRKWEHFNGYHLVTPLMLKPNPTNVLSKQIQPFTIFINRGFVTDSSVSSAKNDAEMISIIASDGDVSNAVPKQVDYAHKSRHATQTEALKEVEVVGIVSRSGRPSYFTPNNEPEKGQWIWADLPALVEYAGGETADVQPMLVESIFEGSTAEGNKLLAAGKPVGRYPAVAFRNQHASYAITWYSLSLGTAFLFYRLVSKKPASNFRRRL